MTKSKDIPSPKCVNVNRSTHKCRRHCCRKPDDRVREDSAPGRQQNLFGNFMRVTKSGRIVEIDPDTADAGPTFKHGRF